MIDLLSVFISSVIILAEFICCLVLFDVLLEKKEVVHNIYPILDIKILVLVVVNWVVANYIENAILKGLLILACYCVFLYFFYKAEIVVKLCVSIIQYILIIVVDSFSVILIYGLLALPLEVIKSNSRYFFFAATFSKTFLFLLVMIIKKIVSSKRHPELNYISKYHWLVYVLQAVITMVSLLSIIELCYRSGTVPFIAIVAALGLLFLNYAILGLLESSARFGKSERENALYQQQIEVETANIKALNKTFTAQKQHMHDYKQQIATIYQLANDSKYDQVIHLIKLISDDIYVSLYRVKTNHDIIDAILNQKCMLSENKGVTLDIRAGDLSEVNIPEHLLVIILSNALDNAIEACDNVITDRIINVKLLNENGIFVYSVINPVVRPIEIQNNMIETTKADRLVHGIGLKNIAFALSKCNGDYELGCDGQTFQFTALIRLKQNP